MGAYCRWNIQQFCRHPRVFCRDEGSPPTEGGGRGIWWARPSAPAYTPASGPLAIDIDQSIGIFHPHIAPLCYTINVELYLARTATGGPPRPTASIFDNWENDMKRTFILNAAGLHTGVRFDFGQGQVFDVMISDLSESVVAHATCNGIGEALRDTGAGKTDAEALAAFLQRREVLLGGAYSARGGSRLDWEGDILTAIAAMLEKSGKALSVDDTGRLQKELAEVGKGGPEAFKKWLAANPTRKAIGKMVDSIRKERAAARAKQATTEIDMDSII